MKTGDSKKLQCKWGAQVQAKKEEVKESAHVSDKRILGKNKITASSKVQEQEHRMVFDKQKCCLW